MHAYGSTLAALALVAAPGAAEPVEVRIPGAEPPAVVDRLDTTENLTALAVGPELEMLAAAYLEQEKPERSSLRFYVDAAAEPRTVEVAGTFRDLLFSVDRERIYGLLHRGARKGAGETQLMIYEIDRGKLRRGLRVPTTARALDHWSARSALLIAAEDEIRSLSLPDLSSGPLFRVRGTNLSLTSLGGGDLVLVGQEDALVLVGLDDPPGQFEMPIRARAQTPDRVVALASAPDGSSILARLADGRLFDVTFNPLRLSPQATSALIARPSAPDAPGHGAAPSSPVEPRTAAPAPDVAEPTAAPATAPSGTAEPAAGIAHGTSVAQETPATHPTPVATPAPAPAPARTDRQVSGRIVGAAAAAVVAVVLLGPDDLSREAARIAPDPAGHWEIDGLAPGRYRILLDGGGSRVLVSEPAFLLLDVPEERNVVAPDFRVRRAL